MLKRNLENYIDKLSAFYPVLLLTGPRQTGKTTLLKMCSNESRKYVTLDTFENRSLAQTDSELFLQRYNPPVLIDEIQYAPNLLSYIKVHIDNDGTPGDFWLTGSQQFLLMKNLSESLAGRCAVISLQGFSQEEKNQTFSDLSFLPTKVLESDEINHYGSGENRQKKSDENDQKSHLTNLIIQFPEYCQKQFVLF